MMSSLQDIFIKVFGGYTQSEYAMASKRPNFGYILQHDTSYAVPDDSLKLTSEQVKTIVKNYFPKASIKVDDSDYWKIDVDKLKQCWYMNMMTDSSLSYSTYFDCNGFSSLCYSVCSLVADGRLAVADVNGYASWTSDAYHAFNMFINLEGEPVLYEPQSGKTYSYDKADVRWIHF